MDIILNSNIFPIWTFYSLYNTEISERKLKRLPKYSFSRRTALLRKQEIKLKMPLVVREIRNNPLFFDNNIQWGKRNRKLNQDSAEDATLTWLWPNLEGERKHTHLSLYLSLPSHPLRATRRKQNPISSRMIRKKEIGREKPKKKFLLNALSCFWNASLRRERERERRRTPHSHLLTPVPLFSFWTHPRCSSTHHFLCTPFQRSIHPRLFSDCTFPSFPFSGSGLMDRQTRENVLGERGAKRVVGKGESVRGGVSTSRQPTSDCRASSTAEGKAEIHLPWLCPPSLSFWTVTFCAFFGVGDTHTSPAGPLGFQFYVRGGNDTQIKYRLPQTGFSTLLPPWYLSEHVHSKPWPGSCPQRSAINILSNTRKKIIWGPPLPCFFILVWCGCIWFIETIVGIHDRHYVGRLQSVGHGKNNKQQNPKTGRYIYKQFLAAIT